MSYDNHGRVDQAVREVWAECTVLDRRRVANAAVSRTTWSSSRIAASEYRRAAVHRNFGAGDVFARLGSAFRSRGTGDTERGSGSERPSNRSARVSFSAKGWL